MGSYRKNIIPSLVKKSFMSKHNGRTMIEDDSESTVAVGSDDLSRNGHHEPVVMDEEDALKVAEQSAYREAAGRWYQWQKGLYASVLGYKSNKLFALECAIAAQGMWEVLGVKDFSELARRWSCTKANVAKLVKKLQKANGMPPAPGQREETGCANMRSARLKQLSN